jgi:cytochrome b6-f complex iron-sulfur subunit
MNRKEFIKTCGIACLGGAAMASILQSCGTANYVAKTAMDGNKMIIKRSEFVLVD